MASVSYLILRSGSVYRGTGFGARAQLATDLKPGVVPFVGRGEVVFNTAMSGYYEVLTDPSYTGQIVAMTYPHMGNYGTDKRWNESGPEDGRKTRAVKPGGFVVRSLYRGPVPSGRSTLDEFLAAHGIPGISDVDTRKLTLELREGGSQQGVIVRPSNEVEGISGAERDLAVAYLTSIPAMEGSNLIGDVGTTTALHFDKPGDRFGEVLHDTLAVRPKDREGITPGLRVVVYDCGAKANIVRELEGFGCKVILHPSTATAADILADKPDGILITNGPGDPAVLDHQVETVRGLFGKMTVTGICLGHQLISRALGATTYKMTFGHHGINHPVRDELSKKVFVTTQNHGFAVDEKTLPKDVKVWFRNANDQTVEGVISPERRVYSAQFHPEAAPGPHDSLWIFGAFLRGMSA